MVIVQERKPTEIIVNGNLRGISVTLNMMVVQHSLLLQVHNSQTGKQSAVLLHCCKRNGV